MSSYDDYFRIDVYGENWGDLVESSKYVFQNKNIGIDISTLVDVLYNYLFDHNLEDLELFLRLVGYSAFTLDEMPDSITNPNVVNLIQNKKFSFKSSIPNIEAAFEYIASNFGNNIMEYFYKIKQNQLCHQNVESYNKIEKTNAQLQRVRELKAKYVTNHSRL